ncbi:triphosphoribosyl-dephospho-CoA synthase [Methyloglobulus sp.]|uniref:triphosphoribosyl-dephospho-CoA synthase n=1 Tax=Methyloglobulus sp. TaxID=2518622 RepID=UPI00398A2199
MIGQHQLAELYRQACEIELQAFKPGNVSVYADGHGMSVSDFRISAEVSSGPLCNPGYCLGEKIFYAVKATREAVRCNTNLGIILLCAPLIQAVTRVTADVTLWQALSQVLAVTTITDADWVFKAITLAAPGGLGDSDEQDVHSPASVTLTQAMQIASDKDRIALQYTTDYKDIFDFAVLRYNAKPSQWRDKNWATAFVYAELLAQYPDSHIERKHGDKYTEWVATRMRQFLEEFGQATDPTQLMQALFCLDTEFKLIGVNPGTTADMTVATILSVLLEEFFTNINTDKSSIRFCSN